jgi:hypothetical protein
LESDITIHDTFRSGKAAAKNNPVAAFCVFRVWACGQNHATRLFNVKGIEEKELP